MKAIMQSNKFQYSMRKHRYGFTIACGNVDDNGNWLDDGSYKDLMTFRDIDHETAERVLVGLMLGNIGIER